jgi:DNA-binding MarR family transcriptional regulator
VAPRKPDEDRERAFRALVRVLRAMRARGRGSFAELGITFPQAQALRAIYDRGRLQPAALAEHLGVTRGNVTGLVDRLEERGLLVRRPSAQDGRSVDLALTAQGRRLVVQAEAASRDALDEGFARLGPEDVRRLVGLLERLAPEPAPARPPAPARRAR